MPQKALATPQPQPQVPPLPFSTLCLHGLLARCSLAQGSRPFWHDVVSGSGEAEAVPARAHHGLLSSAVAGERSALHQPLWRIGVLCLSSATAAGQGKGLLDLNPLIVT